MAQLYIYWDRPKNSIRTRLKLEVLLDDHKIGVLECQRKEFFDLPPGNHVVQVKKGAIKSNTYRFQVNENDTIELETGCFTSPQNYYLGRIGALGQVITLPDRMKQRKKIVFSCILQTAVLGFAYYAHNRFLTGTFITAIVPAVATPLSEYFRNRANDRWLAQKLKDEEPQHPVINRQEVSETLKPWYAKR